jgi:hypothetical protein
MPAMMTKFSVWDADTRQLIKDIYNEMKKHNEKKHIAAPDNLEQSLTNWFYTTGIEVFSKAQGKLHKDFVEAQLAANGVRPEITYEQILKYKKIGFEALYPKFLCDFSIQSGGKLEIAIRDEYQGYKDNGLKHEEFFRLQAEITTELNKALDAHPEWQEGDKIEFTRQHFEAAKTSHPNLVSAIDDQLLLQTEFAAYMKEQMQKTPAGNNVSMFNRSAGADAITIQRARDLADNFKVEEGDLVRMHRV